MQYHLFCCTNSFKRTVGNFATENGRLVDCSFPVDILDISCSYKVVGYALREVSHGAMATHPVGAPLIMFFSLV